MKKTKYNELSISSFENENVLLLKENQDDPKYTLMELVLVSDKRNDMHLIFDEKTFEKDKYKKVPFIKDHKQDQIEATIGFIEQGVFVSGRGYVAKATLFNNTPGKEVKELMQFDKDMIKLSIGGNFESLECVDCGVQNANGFWDLKYTVHLKHSPSFEQTNWFVRGWKTKEGSVTVFPLDKNTNIRITQNGKSLDNIFEESLTGEEKFIYKDPPKDKYMVNEPSSGNIAELDNRLDKVIEQNNDFKLTIENLTKEMEQLRKTAELSEKKLKISELRQLGVKSTDVYLNSLSIKELEELYKVVKESFAATPVYPISNGEASGSSTWTQKNNKPDHVLAKEAIDALKIFTPFKGETK
jgi:hypothetical protein